MTSKIIVHGGWLDDTFFLWGEQTPHSQFNQIIKFQYPFLLAPFELKLSLFCQDQHSFFGTFIPSAEAIIDVPLNSRQFASLAGEVTIYQADEQMEFYSFPIEGITLTPDSLLTYLPLFQKWKEEDDFELAPDFLIWTDLIEQIQDAIAQGAFAPSSSGLWELTNFPYDEWNECMPPAALAIRANTKFIEKQAAPSERLQMVITLITDAMIRSLVNDPLVFPIYSSWKESLDPKWLPQIKQLSKKGQLQPSVTNQTFQQQIGALQQKPFLSGLALKEPNPNEEDWSLSLCMIDRKQPSLIIEMNQLERGEHPWRENPIGQLKHDLQLAKKKVSLLEPLRLSSPTLSLSADEAFDLFTNDDEILKQNGFHLIVPKWMTEKRKPRVTLLMGQQQEGTTHTEPLLDWQSVASFTYDVAIGDHSISEEEFIQFVENKRPFLYTNGEWIAWDPSLADTLKSFLDGMKENASYLDAWRLDQADDEWLNDDEASIEVTWSKQLTDSIKALYSTSDLLIPLPSDLKGELRPYQHEGVSWLAHLRRVGFGGCLADDMGLGKSIQTIAYILYVLEEQKKAKREKQPFLLICPTSLLSNWTYEFEQFAPSLRIFVHHGHSRITENDLDSLDNWDVIMTTYQLIVRDATLFHDIRWNGLLLDEAQQIKNVDTKQRRMIKGIKATHRIALTGTPIENRLRELWSLLDVLNPSYFGSYHHFQAQFIKPIERDRDEGQLEKLKKLIQPLILRRKKSDPKLSLGLPEKKEVVHNVHLSVEQAALYQAVVDDLVTKVNTVTTFERRALILRSLTKLKQICNHPAHFLKEASVDSHDSGKWLTLLSLTDEMIQKKEKVLIFSQYKEMGSLMKKAFEQRYQETVPFLHGSLTRTKRQETIKSFQENEAVHIFILSLKAGGVGLNLTAATNVIHYDRWWNPAVENQATDRAYRIGQINDITVHKMITVGTLEERIDRMLSEKQALADHVLAAGDQPLTELTNDELLELIKLS